MGSNNKRVHESDEPTDSPPTDNTSRASSNGYGPATGSRQVSSSLGSAGRDATSAVNRTGASLSTSVIPSTQGVRGDPSTPSKASPGSTLENSNGPASNSSSPGPLTWIYDGDAVPVTTSDLGRLPLHYGSEFPTNFNFTAIANEWNASGSGQTSTTFGSLQGQGEEFNSRGAQTRTIPGLYPPQEQHPEDLFPWVPYVATVGAGRTATGSVPSLATGAATTRPNAASTYTTPDPNQTKSSLSRNVPSTSPALPGLTEGLLPAPTSDSAEDHTDLFDILFPPSHPPVRTNLPPMVQAPQEPHEGYGEHGYGSLPVTAQAYLHGWSNAPQAFE